MIGGISGVSLNYVDGTTNPPSCSGRCAQLSAELERGNRGPSGDE